MQPSYTLLVKKNQVGRHGHPRLVGIYKPCEGQGPRFSDGTRFTRDTAETSRMYMRRIIPRLRAAARFLAGVYSSIYWILAYLPV